IYRALKPLVTIWPREGGQLNLNTAPPALIASVNDNKTLTPLPAADLERLLEERKAKHVLPPAAVSALLNRQIDSGAYGEASNYFELTAQTDFQGRRYILRSVLRRDQKNVRVVARTLGDW